MLKVPRPVRGSTALSVRVEGEVFRSLSSFPMTRLEDAARDADRFDREKTP